MEMARLFRDGKKKISASFADPSASVVTPAEQRRSERYSNDFRISLLDAQNRPADEAVSLIDMSNTGVGIESRRRFDVGQALGFEMTTGAGAPFSTRALVRWSRPMGFLYSYGLEFEDMGYFARTRLGQFLKPQTYGLVEWATLILEGATSITLILIVADTLKSSPYVLSALTFMLPVFLPVVLLTAFGLFLTRFLKN